MRIHCDIYATLLAQHGYKSKKHNSYSYYKSLNLAIDQMLLLKRKKNSLIYAEYVNDFLSSIVLSECFFIWFCLYFNWAVVPIQYELERNGQCFPKVEQIYNYFQIAQRNSLSHTMYSVNFLSFKCLIYVSESLIILKVVDGYKTYALILKCKW